MARARRTKPHGGESHEGQSEAPESLRGTYVGHPRGFGFLVLEGGGADRFVPPTHEGAAIDGDTVTARPGDGDTVRVTGVVRRGRPLMVGTYLGRGSFSADAHRVARDLSVEGTARKGDKILVAATPQKLRVRRVLGRAGAPSVEDEAVLAELEITPAFPKKALAQASKLHPPGKADYRGRMDLRNATTVVTIDPLTSRDFDDAISLERRGKEWILGVHIADVSHYVRPGTPLDQEAHARGTSVYLPSRVIPMLPETLSNDLCSLREGVDRLTMSVLLRYDANGTLRGTTFAESVIRSDRRFSYERASRVMDRTVREKGDVGSLLLDMAKLAAALKRKRPSLDIPRDEIELIYNGQGDVVDLRPAGQDVAHGVIEEFMLAANREVARLLLRRGVPSLFRHHPEPSDLSGVWETLSRLGAGRATASRKAPTAGLAKAIARAVSNGHGPAIASALLRCMPRAIYTTEAASHFSLGFEAYTHFTSPIRRYSDLVVHRTLRSLLRESGGPIRLRPGARLPAPVADESLERVAEHVTTRAAGSDRAESRIRRRRVMEFLVRLGRMPTEGQITTVVERGLVVELPEYGAWGFLSAEQLPDGPYRFDGGTLRGRRRTFRLGENVEVRVHRIDPASGDLDLALAPRS